VLSAPLLAPPAPQDPKGRLPLELARASAGSGTPLGRGGGAAAGAAALLRSVIDAVQPTTLIGAAAVGGAFDRGVVEALTRVSGRGVGSREEMAGGA
jgi:hypothetical protein